VNHNTLSTALAAASALKAPASGKQIGRLAAAIADAPSIRPCCECKEPTTGSIGAAGIKWPALCQKCKDKADTDLETRIRVSNAFAVEAVKAAFPHIKLSDGDSRRVAEVDRHDKTRAEFHASMEANAQGKVTIDCCVCGKSFTRPVGLTDDLVQRALGANFAPTCWKCSRMQDEEAEL